MKVSRKFFLISLGSLAGILIVYGLLRWKFGAFLPAAVDKNLPDFIMFAAVGIMLWNRKQRSDETKAAAERKRLEEAAAEEAAAEDTAAEEAAAEETAAAEDTAATTTTSAEGADPAAVEAGRSPESRDDSKADAKA